MKVLIKGLGTQEKGLRAALNPTEESIESSLRMKAVDDWFFSHQDTSAVADSPDRANQDYGNNRIMDYDQQLKEIERKQQKLEEQKQQIEAERREREERLARLEPIVQQSGMSAEELVAALIEKYNISVSRGARKSAKSDGERRTRTTVTPELRDKIKHDLGTGRSKSEIQREYGVSYPVVQKVQQGKYDSIG
jgi:transposase